MTAPLTRTPVPSPMPAPRSRSSAGGSAGSGNVRRAWIWVALIPVAFVVAMFVGDGLITLLGYESGAEEPPVPLLVGLLVSIPVTLAAMVPPALAVLFGRRARLEGHRSALLAIALGGAALLFWIVTFLLALVDRAIN